MIKRCKLSLLLVCVIAIFMLIGCTPIERLEKKIGVRNDRFEFINTNSVDKISIQSTRDPGFKFIVTEDNAIRDMYGLLSKAKVSEIKSTLPPDYIFEFHIDNDVKKFYYVVGSDEGNFYNDDEVFTASKSLDEGIIKNLSFIRKPRDFNYIYYQSILEVLAQVKGNQDISNYRVGINIKSDVECLKYIFSNDLNNFFNQAKKIMPNIELVENNEDEFDLVLTVKNRGYDSTNYKTKITVNDKVKKYSDEYYITAENRFKEWNIVTSKPNERPKEW